MPLLTYHSPVPTISETALSRYGESLAACQAALEGGGLAFSGWLDPSRGRTQLSAISQAAGRIRETGSALVCLGVGGSYLGLKAGAQLLAHRAKAPGVRLYFGGWNLSALYHQQLLAALDQEDGLSVVILSKQGLSPEPQTAFQLLKAYLRQRYGRGWQQRVYAVTAPGSGPLREEGLAQGYTLFDAPPDISGRYSVLTPLALLPLAAGGLDIQALLQGAEQAAAALGKEGMATNPSWQYAVAVHHAQQALGKSVELLAVTEPAMMGLARWLQQLFAESEGKGGRGVFPVPVLYSHDLHSLNQFFCAGAPLFFETLIYPEQSPPGLDLGGFFPEYTRLNQALEETLAESHGCRMPLNRLALRGLDEESLGYACYFFMKAAALRALLLGADPFSQPAVDACKLSLLQKLGAES